MKKILYILTLITYNIQAQSIQSIQTIDTTDYDLRKKFETSFKEENKSFFKELKNKYNGKTGKELVQVYKTFETAFIKEINDKNFTFKSGIEKYIEKIAKQLPYPNINKTKYLIARNNNPNAYCMPNGYFIINTGLINILDNKEQLLAVMAHEFSHAQLEHNIKMQIQRITKEIESKKKVNNIQNEKYNRSTKAFDLLKEQLYANSQQKRKHEIQADSLGYLLYAQTPFKKQEFLGALKSLKTYNNLTPEIIKTETYKKIFTLPNQSFNEHWLKQEDFSAYNYNNYKDKINKDSLATHPEIEDRIAYIKTNHTETTKETKKTTNDPEFDKIKSITKLEIIPNFYIIEDYGYGIYSTLLAIQNKQNTDAFNKYWLGQFFNKIYQARKNYLLNRYLDNIDPKNQSTSYQQYLNFMWNLNLTELKNIADYYSKPL